ncbi:MAG: DUF86 domain-containing protein [Anaerolineae bacterium]
MVDRDTVEARLAAIREYVVELEHFRQLTFEEFSSGSEYYWAVEHGLQLAAQAAMDVAVHILAADFNHRFENYKEAFEKLGEENVLPRDFAMRFALLAGFRNILVHDYLKVDLKLVYGFLQNNLDDLRAFTAYIVEYLRQRDASDE